MRRAIDCWCRRSVIWQSSLPNNGNGERRAAYRDGRAGAAIVEIIVDIRLQSLLTGMGLPNPARVRF